MHKFINKSDFQTTGVSCVWADEGWRVVGQDSKVYPNNQFKCLNETLIKMSSGTL